MVYHIYYVYVKSFNLRSKFFLMIHDFSNVLIFGLLIPWEFLDLHSSGILAYGFLVVFLWPWYQGNGVPLKWVWALFSPIVSAKFQKDWYLFLECLVEFTSEAICSGLLFGKLLTTGPLSLLSIDLFRVLISLIQFW